MREIVAARMLAGAGAEPLMSTLTDHLTFGVRQRRRAIIRRGTFADVNKKFGPEPRANRRRMGLRIARRLYHNAGEV